MVLTTSIGSERPFTSTVVQHVEKVYARVSGCEKLTFAWPWRCYFRSLTDVCDALPVGCMTGWVHYCLRVALGTRRGGPSRLGDHAVPRRGDGGTCECSSSSARRVEMIIV
jgi:hypothetical protein